MRGLDGRSAIVTGGGSGIGRATAIRLAQEGARVAIGDIRDDDAAETVELVRAAGVEAIAAHCDVGDAPQVAALTARVVEAFGRVDILVANAGISARAPLHELSLDDWDRVIRVNLTGTFLCCRSAVRQMLSQGEGGSIITIGSVQSLVVAGHGAACYKASKGGILMLTRAIAADYADDGIRANCVCPGWIDTNMPAHMEQESGLWTSQATRGVRTYPLEAPIRRPAHPSEVAGVVAFLASSDASFMTGAAVPVDGGFLAV